MESRSRGSRRRTGETRRRASFTPGLGKDSFENETRVNAEQVASLEQMFRTHPSLVAAANVIRAQLLSGGLMLRRGGQPIEMTPEFKQHIDRKWVPFARDVIDSFLIQGYSVVSYEDDDDGDVVRDSSEESVQGERRAVVPIVPPIGSYGLVFRMVGRMGYKRQYKVYPAAAMRMSEPDEEVHIYVRDDPDANGNINSPVACVANMASFIDTLFDLAVEAEVGRANPIIVTQPPRQTGASSVNPSDMFFDTESQEMHGNQVRNDNRLSAELLRMQLQLCAEMNQRRTPETGFGAGLDISRRGSTGAKLSPAARAAAASAGSLATRMFALPKDQEMTSYPLPQARADLGDLIRQGVEQMCAAMGVPSSLVMEARYASQSTSQLALLNSTIQQLAQSVDLVLTQCYLDIYERESSAHVDGTSAQRPKSAGGEQTTNPSTSKSSGHTNNSIELVTTSSQLSSATEVVAVFQAGLTDFETAAPLAMHAMGASNPAIHAALERHKSNLSKGDAQSMYPIPGGKSDMALALKSTEMGQANELRKRELSQQEKLNAEQMQLAKQQATAASVAAKRGGEAKAGGTSDAGGDPKKKKESAGDGKAGGTSDTGGDSKKKKESTGDGKAGGADGSSDDEGGDDDNAEIKKLRSEVKRLKQELKAARE